MNLRDYFAMQARYHVWATDRLLQHVAAISEEHYRQDTGLFFKSIHGTLNHMLVAELLWYTRFTDSGHLPFQLNDEIETDRPALVKKLQDAAGKWSHFMETLPENGYDAALHYSRVSGAKVSLPYCPTLGHVFNHGTHHRAQITASLTALNYPCPELDMVYMLLEECK